MAFQFKKKKKVKVRGKKKRKREHGGPMKGKDPREAFFQPGGPFSKGRPVPGRYK